MQVWKSASVFLPAANQLQRWAHGTAYLGHTASETAYLQVSRPERPKQSSYEKQVNPHLSVLPAGVFTLASALIGFLRGCETSCNSPHPLQKGL